MKSTGFISELFLATNIYLFPTSKFYR